jgi:hypothetical protein
VCHHPDARTPTRQWFRGTGDGSCKYLGPRTITSFPLKQGGCGLNRTGLWESQTHTHTMPFHVFLWGQISNGKSKSKIRFGLDTLHAVWVWHASYPHH